MELLTVISIIGILAAILTPMIGSAVNSAKKSKARRGLQQIAMAYVSFSTKGFASELNTCKKANEWAAALAKHEEMNVASMFILSDDYLVEAEHKLVPKTVVLMKNGTWVINQDFEKFPLSIVVIAGVASRSPSSTTPIAYTRGLDNDSGKWRASNGSNGGVYGEEGGFIVFLDGHVEFYANLTDEKNMLMNYYTGEKTSKISEAVNYGARALSWTGIDWEAAKN
jgi:type II secretory pathway pseudopilin PulG